MKKELEDIKKMSVEQQRNLTLKELWELEECQVHTQQ